MCTSQFPSISNKLNKTTFAWNPKLYLFLPISWLGKGKKQQTMDTVRILKPQDTGNRELFIIKGENLDLI